VDAGFFSRVVLERHPEKVTALIDIILGELHRPGPFDFGDRGFVAGLKQHGMGIASDKAAWYLPPADLLFVQRKISGTALLAARLEAIVEIRQLIGQALA
jgi:hypothetical protein